MQTLKKSKHAQNSGKLVDKYLKDVIAHKCHVCSKNILCDKATIQCHVRNHHNFSLKKYCDKMNIELVSEISKKKKVSVQLFTKLSSKQEITNKIGSFCKFSCPKCDFTSKSWNSLKVHITKNEHGPVLPFTKYITSLVYHKCHECDELVPNDTGILSLHVRSQHKMTLPNYRTSITMPNIEEQRDEYLSKLKTVIQDIPMVQPQINRILKAGTLSENQVTKDVGNLSFFKCPVCSKTNMNFAMLVYHCKREHQGRQLVYNKEYVVEARYHRCFICAKILLCDNAMISSHVYATHHVILSSYIKDFVLKGGGKVFPTFQEYCHNNQTFKIIKE